MLASVLTGLVYATLLDWGMIFIFVCLFMLMQHPPAPYGGYTNGQYYGGYGAGPYVSCTTSSSLHGSSTCSHVA